MPRLMEPIIVLFLLNRKAFNSKCSNDIADGNGSPSNVTDIRIPGVSCYAITKIIEFAYLRTCDLTETNVYEILVVADYVALIGLLKYCIKFLTRSLCPENCVGIMRFAL